eukprot:NODE_15459_length_219_cov_7.864706_g14546_i0.p3 GENE.NODE_15459_length_219_cov_7.864706_g14546_i0~~NODE_15459_length_219_cov_7.864706_g14546_i0.p3  ORF type:complete len:56 (-),score=12.72 NODE_15459_length_219_cov_7.864706_g14546_i0:8-175(-)
MLLFPLVMAGQPSGLLLYFLTNLILVLIQSRILNISAVRRRLNIPQLLPHHPGPR